MRSLSFSSSDGLILTPCLFVLNSFNVPTLLVCQFSSAPSVEHLTLKRHTDPKETITSHSRKNGSSCKKRQPILRRIERCTGRWHWSTHFLASIHTLNSLNSTRCVAQLAPSDDLATVDGSHLRLTGRALDVQCLERAHLVLERGQCRAVNKVQGLVTGKPAPPNVLVLFRVKGQGLEFGQPGRSGERIAVRHLQRHKRWHVTDAGDGLASVDCQACNSRHVADEADLVTKLEAERCWGLKVCKAVAPAAPHHEMRYLLQMGGKRLCYGCVR